MQTHVSKLKKKSISNKKIPISTRNINIIHEFFGNALIELFFSIQKNISSSYFFNFLHYFSYTLNNSAFLEHNDDSDKHLYRVDRHVKLDSLL